MFPSWTRFGMFGLLAATGLRNVHIYLRDFLSEGTGLPPASMDYAMLFNILHAEQPERLLRESHRILVPGGLLGIIHWNYDPTTPRGPSMEIRPRPEQCRDWAEQEGFRLCRGSPTRPRSPLYPVAWPECGGAHPVFGGEDHVGLGFPSMTPRHP